MQDILFCWFQRFVVAVAINNIKRGEGGHRNKNTTFIERVSSNSWWQLVLIYLALLSIIYAKASLSWKGVKTSGDMGVVSIHFMLCS